MRSPAFYCGLCAFFALASAVVSAPPYRVMNEADILDMWLYSGSDWGIEDCFPDGYTPTVCEIVSCTRDGFSGFYPEFTYQDISGRITATNAFCWLAGYPLVTAGGDVVLPFPTLSDFMLHYESPGIGVLPTYNFNSLTWSVTNTPPLRAYKSSFVSNMLSACVFNWTGAPVLTEYYVGVNYAPRWWADGNIIGCIPSSLFEQYFQCMGYQGNPIPVPAIYVADTDLRNVFTNSIHFKFGELWE